MKFESNNFYVVSVETINSCTRKCSFCKFGNYDVNGVKYLSEELINKIILELKNINFKGRLSWFGINEPLLDNRIYNILKKSREKLPKVFLSLQTNGDLLTLEKFELLIKNGLDYLGVSVYDDNTNSKVLFIKNNSIFGKRLIIKDYRITKYKNFENRGGNVDIKNKFQNNFLYLNCLRPSSGLSIDYNGNVKLCVGDFFSNVINMNIRNYSLLDIWNSDIFNFYRMELQENGRKNLRLCSKCNYGGFRVNPVFPLKHPDI